MDVEEILTALQSVGASDYPPFLRGTLRESRLASASSFMKNDRATDNTTNTDRQPSREEAIALLKGGLGDALLKAAANYVMPIFWVAAQEGRPLIAGNGSAFLLDAGQGPFLVTAGHVYEGYRRCRESHPDAACIVGDLRFDIEKRKIAHDQAYDVATFKVTSEEVAQWRDRGRYALTGSQASWPPPPPQVGCGMFLVGFPGDGRRLHPYRGKSIVEVDWVGYSVLSIAESVSASGITLVLDHEQSIDIGERQEPPADWALGGCSGAPILTFVEHCGVFTWRLGGIVRVGGPMCEDGPKLLKASRADCLNPDATINPFPDPMVYARIRQRRWADPSD